MQFLPTFTEFACGASITLWQFAKGAQITLVLLQKVIGHPLTLVKMALWAP